MKTVQVELGAHLTVTNMHELPVRFEIDLTRALVRPNPDVSMRQKLGIYTGNIPSTLCLYHTRIHESGEKCYYIDRGCYDVITSLANRHSLKVSFKDNRVLSPVPPLEFDGALESYQEDALTDHVLKKTQGMLCFPTGGGKTVTACNLITRLNQKTIVCVHTHDLLEQWVKNLQRFISNVGKVGVIGGGKKKIGDVVTVATVQTVLKLVHDQEFVNQFGLVILDEAHRVAAPTFREIIGNFPAKYRYGLTATPKRRDGKSFYLNSIFGPILVELDYDDVKDRVVMPTIYPVTTSLAEDYSGAYFKKGREVFLNYTNLFGILSKDFMRNMIILDLIKRRIETEPMSSILVLTKRRQNAVDLQQFLKDQGLHSEVVLGGGTVAYRKRKQEIFEETRQGKNKILIGTSVADEGLDIVVLNTLILASPTSWSGILKQRLGRIMRKCEGKLPPVVYDLVDSAIPELKDAWYARRRVYNKHEMEIVWNLFTSEEES